MMTRRQAIVAALIVASAGVLLLDARYRAARRDIEAAAAALDVANSTRREMARAYLFHARASAGDPTFDLVAADDAIGLARLGLRDWLWGREGSVGVRGVPRLEDPALRALVRALDADLVRFEAILHTRESASHSVAVRTAYATAAARADSVLALAEMGVVRTLRGSDRAHVVVVLLLVIGILGTAGVLWTTAARQQAAAERTHVLRELAEALVGARDPAAIALAVRRVAGSALGAPLGATVLLEDEGRALCFIETFGYHPPAPQAGTRVANDPRAPVARALATGVVDVRDVAVPAHDTPEVDAVVAALGVHTVVALPFLVSDAGGTHPVGAMTFEFRESRTLELEEREFLAAIANVAAQALARALAAQAEGRARAEAVTERARLVAVLEQLPVGVILVDGEERLRHRNSRFAELMHRAPATASGSGIVRGVEGPVHADGTAYAPHEYPIVRAVRDGERVEQEVTRYRHADGSESLLAISALPIEIPGETGRVAVGTVADVSALYRTTEALEQSEARFRLMAERLPLGVLRTDADGGLAFANTRLTEITGSGERALLGQGWRTLLDPAERRRIEELRSLLRRRGTDRERFELRIRRASDGVRRQLVVDFVFLHDPEGRIVGGIGTVEDVTERQSLEAQLRQAQKMEAIGRLAGGVAHDFNNLLTVIGGGAEMLLGDPRLDDEQRADIREVLEASQRAGELTRQLLSFSRQQILAVHAGDLNDAVTRAHRMLSRVIGPAVPVRLELEPGLPVADFDTGAIEQILMNLAVNARDAMPDGGTLTLRTRAAADAVRPPAPLAPTPGGYVALDVVDTGTGMDEAVLAHMFEPFFTTKDKGRGTGLGLAMVYGLARQMHGFVTVESALGHGTRFTVHLPRAVAARSAASGTGAAAGSARGSERLLVVEDEPALRALVVRTLRDLGYRVLEAGAVAEARALISGNPDIALVLSDVMMPGGLGTSLATWIGQEHPSIRVLLMTGHQEEGAAGAEAARRPYIAKPFTLRALAARVRAELDAPVGHTM